MIKAEQVKQKMAERKEIFQKNLLALTPWIDEQVDRVIEKKIHQGESKSAFELAPEDIKSILNNFNIENLKMQGIDDELEGFRDDDDDIYFFHKGDYPKIADTILDRLKENGFYCSSRSPHDANQITIRFWVKD